jgi:DNA-binding Xre family transcriptional regulator
VSANGTATEVDWRPIWRAVEDDARRRQWSLNELYRRTGVSQTTFAKMRDGGVPLVRPDKVEAMLRGLGWAPGSIEAILAGGAPKRADEVDPVTLPDALAAIRSELRDLRRRMEQLEQRD